MNKYNFAFLASIFALSAFASQSLAQSEQTYSQGYDPGLVPRTTVLDSWMEPTVIRTREITNANGEKQSIAEPIIMERHESVILPSSEAITTTTTSHGARVLTSEESSVSSAVSRTAHRSLRTHVAHRRSVRAAVAHAVLQKKFIAKRTVIESVPTTTVEVQRQIIDRAVIIERRDPSLNNY